MSRPLSLFTVYKSDENTVTNYCGLILRLLYEESTSAFAAALESMTTVQLVVGPEFRQQEERRKENGENGESTKSTPDLTITQNAFSVIVETKLGSGFDRVQFENHLEPRPEGKVVLILLGKGDGTDLTREYSADVVQLQETEVTLVPLTYDEFVRHLEDHSPSDEFRDYVEEFRGFLNGLDLLPSWGHRLDVVNCARTLSTVRKIHGYVCPAAGGNYSHQRAKFFGAYSNKGVPTIFQLDALYEVVASIDGPVSKPVTLVSDHTCRWRLDDVAEQDEVTRVDSIVHQWFADVPDRGGERALQVFLLSQPSDCDFRKSTSGGMVHHRRYFDLAEFVEDSGLPLTAGDVAELLNGKTWG